jgi:hypothetical protein
VASNALGTFGGKTCWETISLPQQAADTSVYLNKYRVFGTYPIKMDFHFSTAVRYSVSNILE